jgi:hemoglobin
MDSQDRVIHVRIAPDPAVADIGERPLTLFERIGGAAVVDRLVEAFYREMDHQPDARAIRGMYPADLGPPKAVLKRYLGEWMGGPKLYSAEESRPRLRQRHLCYPIGEEERDAWLSCLRAALAETVADGVCRAEIDAQLTRLADWMRNQPGNPHDARK